MNKQEFEESQLEWRLDKFLSKSSKHPKDKKNFGKKEMKNMEKLIRKAIKGNMNKKDKEDFKKLKDDHKIKIIDGGVYRYI